MKTEQLTCARCGTPFEKRAGNQIQKYCSKACKTRATSDAYRKRHPEKITAAAKHRTEKLKTLTKLRPPRERSCRCGKTFMTKNNIQKYCTPECAPYLYTPKPMPSVELQYKRDVLPAGFRVRVGQIVSEREVTKKLEKYLQMRCLRCGLERLIKSANVRAGDGCQCRVKPWSGRKGGSIVDQKALAKRHRSVAAITYTLKNGKGWCGAAKRINNGAEKRPTYSPLDRVTWEGPKLAWETSNGKCAFCALPLTRNSKCFNTVHWDHNVPMARGGPHINTNITATCRSCNRLKDVLTGEEFRLALDGKFDTIYGAFRVLGSFRESLHKSFHEIQSPVLKNVRLVRLNATPALLNTPRMFIEQV